MSGDYYFSTDSHVIVKNNKDYDDNIRAHFMQKPRKKSSFRKTGK